MELKNYSTTNLMDQREEKAWCLTTQAKKSVQQANIALNDGNIYSYASRYPVIAGDVCIIGNSYTYSYALGNDPMATTGQMGIVKDTTARLMVSKAHAAELDFVFTCDPSKKYVKACADYLEVEANENTLQFGKETSTIYPMTFFIRKILAACSVLAFPDKADEDAISRAKQMLQEKYILTPGIMQIYQACPEFANISVGDIHVNLENENLKELLSYQNFLTYDCPAYLDGFDRPQNIEGKDIENYFNKYVYIGAVSIMVRGGFCNLLEVFLKENPPIKDFYEEMLEDICHIGSEKAIEMLRGWKK